MVFWKLLPVFIGLIVSGCATVGGGSAAQRRVIQVQVEQGDSLNTIAKQFDTDWRDIALINKATLKGGLHIGQVLNVIPGPKAQPAIAQAQGANGFEEAAEDDEDNDMSFLPRRKGMLFGSPKDKSAVDFIFPVEGRITSYFGKRGRKQHKGIDISANVGTPILASADGEVIFAGRRRGYGTTVVVDHSGFLTLYAHCSKLIASVGDTVRQGDFIAKAGRSGNARGAHLHFEIRDGNNVPLDPVAFLRHRSIAQRGKAKKNVNGAVAKSGPQKPVAKRGLLYATGE